VGTILLWFTSSGFSTPGLEAWQLMIIFLLVAMGLYVAFSRLRRVYRGEPVEDELSKKILQKASSLSFYISLYLWVAMIYIKDRVTVDTEVLLGSGILGMAIIWVILVIYFKVRGLKDA